MLASQNVWIVAALRPTPRGFDLHLEDERGLRLTPRAGDKRRRWRTLSGVERVRVPARTTRFVREAFERHQAGPGPRHLLAKRIPVFVQSPPERSQDAWELHFEAIVPHIVQPVSHAHRSGVTRRPWFNLPIDVVSVGKAREYLHSLESASWYRKRPAVREHGLVIKNTDREGLAAALQERSRDVVVAMESDWPRVLSDAHAIPFADGATAKNAAAQPRLIILIVHSTFDLPIELLEGAPKGTALLLVRRDHSSAQRILREFFFGVFHDLPLHGALWKLPRHSARLIADPATNQSIRISEALAQVRDLTQDLTQRFRHGASAGNVEPFIARSRRDTRAWRDIATTLRAADSASAQIAKTIDRSDRLAVDFLHESRGLVPMAEVLAGLRNADRLIGQIQAPLAKLARSSTMSQALEQAQQRYVDIALEEHASLSVERYWSLRTNSDCRLRVQIGHRSRDSLIVGNPPPVDPLLPELTEHEPGYELDVVVFEKDFHLHSERLLRLFLPRLGGSQPVYFQIRTPRSAGTAELRINIYYRNHLVQGFRSAGFCATAVDMEAGAADHHRARRCHQRILRQPEAAHEARHGHWRQRQTRVAKPTPSWSRRTGTLPACHEAHRGGYRRSDHEISQAPEAAHRGRRRDALLCLPASGRRCVRAAIRCSDSRAGVVRAEALRRRVRPRSARDGAGSQRAARAERPGDSDHSP